MLPLARSTTPEISIRSRIYLVAEPFTLASSRRPSDESFTVCCGWPTEGEARLYCWPPASPSHRRRNCSTMWPSLLSGLLLPCVVKAPVAESLWVLCAPVLRGEGGLLLALPSGSVPPNLLPIIEVAYRRDPFDCPGRCGQLREPTPKFGPKLAASSGGRPPGLLHGRRRARGSAGGWA